MTRKSKHHIVSSTDFVDKHKHQHLAPGEKLMSYDVCALFTSILIPKALEMIKTRLENDYHMLHRSKLKSDQLLELLELCPTTTYFSYKGEFYEQKHGAAMGSPVSPVITNLHMEYFEQKALQSAVNPPSVWYRYMDDIMTCIQEAEITNFSCRLHPVHLRDRRR